MSPKPNGSESGGSESGGSGLRPGVAQECRRALASLCLDHISSCSFCSARAAAVTSLAAFSAQRPVSPAALRGPDLLEAIYQQASEEAEQSALGRWVEEATAAPAAEVPIGSWEQVVDLEQVIDPEPGDPEPGIEKSWLQSPPPQPDSEVWSGVRRSILAGVASDRVTSRKPRRWWLGFLGAAAIIILGLVITEGPTGRPESDQPVVVFADLDRAPDIDFAIVRYGTRR